MPERTGDGNIREDEQRGAGMVGETPARRRPPAGMKCRHCVRLYAGACPYPGSWSVHRMQLGSGGCELAVLDRRFAGLYRRRGVRRGDCAVS